MMTSSIIIFDENLQNNKLIEFLEEMFKADLSSLKITSIAKENLNGTKDNDLFNLFGTNYTKNNIRPILITFDKNQKRKNIEVKLREKNKISNIFLPKSYSQKPIKDKILYIINTFSALVEIAKNDHNKPLNLTLPAKSFSITKNDIISNNKMLQR